MVLIAVRSGLKARSALEEWCKENEKDAGNWKKD